jgi:DNA-binding transcriptional ArsR family regulator
MTDALSTTFAALADPTRRAILARLALGETSVTELAEPFDISLPAISKHLKVLEHAGLIARGREAQWRPCRIAPVSLRQVDGWLGNFRKFWDENFNRLDTLLEEMKADEAIKAAGKTKPKVRVKKEKQRGRKSR